MDLIDQLNSINPLAFFTIYTWSMLWKGLALWHSSKLGQKNWFVALLVLNTLGILEISYLFLFSKKKFDVRSLKFWQ